MNVMNCLYLKDLSTKLWHCFSSSTGTPHLLPLLEVGLLLILVVVLEVLLGLFCGAFFAGGAGGAVPLAMSCDSLFTSEV
jgi:hypothetical protein